MKGMRMWEWWRKVEEDYREKRRQEDELRERERRERVRRQTADEALAEVLKNPLPFEELVAEMERNWGIEVDWEEWGMVRPKPRGIQVEVVMGEERARQNEEGRLQKSGHEGLMRRALVMVLTGRWRN